jgi:type II secretory pathway pseudopilin PulG
MASKVQMISATGNRSGQANDRVGFTLIEIVLVLGLIAVATAVLITNFASIADRGDSLSTEEVLIAAVRRARFIAASERTITQLHFDKESNSLQISIGSNAVEDLPLDESFQEARSAEVRFYLVPSSRGLAPPADAIRTRLETEMVYFAADRSSSPFVAEIDTGSGTPERLQFDPFSSLVITSK